MRPRQAAGWVLMAFTVASAAQSRWHWDALAAAPAAAKARSNPYTAEPGLAAAGAKLFRRHCAACHGEDAGGSLRAPGLNVAPMREASDGTLHWFLRNGNVRHGMPAWGGLPPQQLWALVAFLRQMIGAAPAPALLGVAPRRPVPGRGQATIGGRVVALGAAERPAYARPTTAGAASPAASAISP